MERWAIIKDNPQWEVSTCGIIRKIGAYKLISIRKRKDGYLDCKLSGKNYLVHRLVAIAFIPNPYALKQVNHIDGIRDNSTVTNLEWVDQYANMKHAIKIGLFPIRKGIKNGRAIISEATALSIKQLLILGFTNKEISAKLKVEYGIVANIKYKKAWKWLEV